MIELTNKRVSYNVSNSDDTLTVTGSVQLSTDNKVDSFNGQILDNDKNYKGTFYYSENSDSKISKNMNDVNADILSAAENLITATVSELKTKIAE